MEYKGTFIQDSLLPLKKLHRGHKNIMEKDVVLIAMLANLLSTAYILCKDISCSFIHTEVQVETEVTDGMIMKIQHPLKKSWFI